MFVTPFDYKLAFLLSAAAYTDNINFNYERTNPFFAFLMYKSAVNITAEKLTPEERKDFFKSLNNA